MDHSGDNVDPITLEVLWSRLREIPAEMGVVLKRTAFSEAIKYAEDLSTAIFTSDGKQISQGLYTPGFLGAMPQSLEAILEEHVPVDRWNPGDVILTNDPHIGAGHLPDFFTFEPIYLDEHLIGFSATVGHQIDIGGSAPGSFSVYADDMFEEGLQIPPVKFQKSGEINRELFDMIRANSRMPDRVEGDIRAQLNASKRGRELFCELAETYGIERLDRYMREILDRTERTMRDSIREIPDGTYSFTEMLDGFEEPMPISVEMTISGDDLVLDFEGTAEQQPHYAINCTKNYVMSYSYYAIKAAIDPTTPQTDGAKAPITLKAPSGTIVNPKPPVPVAARHLILDHVVSAVNNVLHQALPGQIPAAGSQLNTITMKFTDAETGTQKILLDCFYGGAGARKERDGYPAVAGATNIQNNPVEVLEENFPVHVNQYELRPDSAGAGRRRGGSGTVREFRFLEEANVQCLFERFRSGPYGLEEGRPGEPGGAILNPDTDETQDVPPKSNLTVQEGDVLRVYTPGGGGYGEAQRREESKVHDDVSNGIVTRDVARSDYGTDVPQFE